MSAKTAMMVHDDAELVESVRVALGQKAPDIQLVNALSGPRAIGMMAQGAPDVLVVDAELAGVDGYAFTRQVKTAAATAQVPVIIVSLDPNEVSALKARQVGAAAHLPSTGSIDPLVAKIVALASAGQPTAAAVASAAGRSTGRRRRSAPRALLPSPCSSPSRHRPRSPARRRPAHPSVWSRWAMRPTVRRSPSRRT